MKVFSVGLCCVTLCFSSYLVAQEELTKLGDALKNADEIVVPEGSGDEVVEFMKEMSQMQQEVAQTYRAAMAKISAAQLQASNQILDDAKNVTDEQFYEAAKSGLTQRIRGIANANEEKRGELFEQVKRQLTIGLENGVQQSEMYNASMLASYLERYGEPKLALEAYRTFSELLSSSDSPNAKRYGDQLAGSARRLGLLGNPIDLEGQLIDGSKFDWESYRGKVVLVDFWATWCGPCIAEAPNVRQQYDLYHELGFEVVGISLDTKKNALEAYIKKEGVPWVNLYEDGAGWKHPMAVKYGVKAIPTVMLIDREGKVVSLNARGRELPNLLAKQFSSKSDWERAVEIYSRRIADQKEDAALIARRAAAYMALEHWDLAFVDWERAIALQPDLAAQAFQAFRSAERYEEAVKFGLMKVKREPNDPLAWLIVAPYMHALGRDADLRVHCKAMIEQFRETKDSRAARLTTKACTLVPGLISIEELPENIVNLTEQSALGGAWNCSIGAVLAYRAGEFERALELLEKSRTLPKIAYATSVIQPTRAMLELQRGETTAAEKLLRDAKKTLDELRGDEANRGFHDLLIAEMLFREAQSMIDTAEAK